MRAFLALAAFACLGVVAVAQPAAVASLESRFKENRGPWEAMLGQGEATAVRKAAEALIAREGQAVNPSNYNDMHALVALRGLAAKACVGEGAWEDALDHLEKGKATATENLTAAQATFDRLRGDHQARIKASQEAVSRQEPRFKELEEAPGLTAEQIKLRQQLRTFMEEHRAAIKHSEESLKAMDGILELLKQDQSACAKSVEEWQAFLAKEKAETAEAGGSMGYVVAKVEQVKADDTRPRLERLAYARRLQRLDASNKDLQRLVNALMGRDEEPLEKPKATKRKGKKA
ncbi:MAG TPA: hypothetical protein VJ505_08645 [Holophagaceae bacterium]|nr:hypothetical protein [Holophagaceae bacterium]